MVPNCYEDAKKGEIKRSRHANESKKIPNKMQPKNWALKMFRNVSSISAEIRLIIMN